MAAAATTFSYAQAAKGGPVPQSSSQDDMHVNEQNTPTVSQQGVDGVEGSKPVTADAQTSGDDSHATAETSEVQGTPTVNGISQDSTAEVTKSASARDTRSRATSPSVSSNAASKSLREDDVSATPAESESTWEKISQSSQSGNATEKSDGHNEGKRLSTYEQARPQMKEAPLPVVNIWQKRMEDAQAKSGSKSISPPNKAERSIPQSNNDAHSKRSASKTPYPSSQSFTAEDKNQQRAAQQSSTTIVSSSAQPVLPSDTGSWPTPDLVKSEDKKINTDRVESSEKPTTKPHGKEKWEKVAFVPTAKFNTPIPTRGGARGGRIGGRGGREGMTRGGSISSSTGPIGDSSTTGNNVENQAPVDKSSEQTKPRDTSRTRTGLAPRQKRSSSAGAVHSKDHGPFTKEPFEKREGFNQRSGNIQRSNDVRRESVSTPTDDASNGGHVIHNDVQKRNSIPNETNGEPRYPRAERTYHPRAREPGHEQNGYIPVRERGEGRAERGGRGNWRGRSGAQNHAGFNGASHYQSSFANGKPYAEQRHHAHPNQFPTTKESRHSRNNSRSQSISNGQPYGRYAMPNIGANGLPVLQTDVANTAFHAQSPSVMSAITFNPYMEQVQLPAMVQMQLEYYFSLDNLCKDVFLRKHMDGQGFVFLSVLAQFNRIQILTTDINLLRWVCVRSSNIEFRTSYDGIDRIRKAEDWQPWVLPVEERDPSAQNDGPVQLVSPQYEAFPPAFHGFEGYPAMQPNVPMSPVNGFMANNFRAEPFPGDVHSHRNQFASHLNGQTSLSADVPDFKPSQSHDNRNPASSPSAEPEQKFSDAAVEALKIVIKDIDSELPFVPAPDKEKSKLTNGIGGHNEDNRVDDTKTNRVPDEPHVNGVAHHEEKCVLTKTSPESQLTDGSPEHLSNGVSAHEKQASETVSARITWTSSSEDSSDDGETYDALRSRARQDRRETAVGNCPRSMTDLYEFLSLFLVDNFNTRLYQDFHGYALDDANTKQSLVGLQYLAEFYVKSLFRKGTTADRLLKDFVDLATIEFNNHQRLHGGPASTELHKVWKDQSLNLVNRLNLSSKINDDLKQALNNENSSP